MGQDYLIDTNVLIDFQTKVIPQNGFEFVSKIIDQNFTVSFVSYIEVLGYKNVTESMERFMALADVIETNKMIIDQTLLLRKGEENYVA